MGKHPKWMTELYSALSSRKLRKVVRDKTRTIKERELAYGIIVTRRKAA